MGYFQKVVNLTKRLERGDAQLAYEDAGSGEQAVVLLHGAGLDHTMFDDQAGALIERGIRVIVCDLRGHGESAMKAGTRFSAQDTLRDLDALLSACGHPSPVLVGHSLGGNLAQAFTRAHPDRVSGLIVLGSTWNTGPLSAMERLGLRLAAPALAAMPARTMARLMARASAVRPEAVTRAESVFARMPKSVFLDVWRATTSFVEPDPTYLSPVPLALVRGAEDRTGNIASAMARWAAAEGVRERVIPGAGHILTWDAPAETSRTLCEILDEWRAAEPGRAGRR